ncbi:MAG: hypothetical protein IT581_16855 [Verrucomicrobiales bacterium]|nr:hypothetical protein [Verrucomicrobiales bacterium]
MHSPRTFTARIGIALALACGAGAAWAQGEKIEFTTPAESAPVKPLTERDLGERRFNFQRRDLNPQNDIPTGSGLPAPDQVNQSRALQELLERGAIIQRRENGEDGLSGKDPLRPRGAETSMGIDDLFESRDRSTATEPDSSGNDSRGFRYDDRLGSDRDDRENRFRRGRDRDSDGSPNRDNFDSKEDTDSGFLPSLNLRLGESSASKRDNREGRRDSFIDFNRSGPRNYLDDRDREAAKIQSQSMESFRRMFNTGLPGGNRSLNSAVRNGGVTGGGAPNPADRLTTGASGSVSDVLGSRDQGIGTTPEAIGATRAIAVPLRPVEVDLAVTRSLNKPNDHTETAPALRPMQMFQQKHDTRIPSRVF